MSNLLNHLKIKSKLLLIGGTAFIGMFLLALLSIQTLESALLNEEKKQVQYLVETAHSIISYYNQQEQSGRLSTDEAKAAAKDAVRNIRYGAGKQYFWINDLQHRVIMHPTKPKINGLDMSNKTDANGKYHWQEMVSLVKSNGSGFVDYYFQPPDKQARARHKISFVKGFKDWGWVVGTGIYLDDLEKTVSNTIQSEIILLLIIFFFSGFVSWMVSRNIVNSISSLHKNIVETAKNKDLTRNINITTNDEIGEMASAFNLMISSFRDIVNTIQNHSQEVIQQTSELKTIASGTSQGVQQQYQDTQQVVESITQMASSITDVAEKANSAADSAMMINNSTQESLDNVHQAINNINLLADDINNASETINTLESHAGAIGQVVGVIRGIAEQTNLLALNAAIEAARAGETGRGFAVVADEVRALANKTQESTTDIQNSIEALQQTTGDAVSVMIKGNERINETVEKSNTAGDSLSNTGNEVKYVSQQLAQVAENTEQQKDVANTIQQNISNVAKVAQNTAHDATETRKISEKLTGFVEQMQQELSKLKV